MDKQLYQEYVNLPVVATGQTLPALPVSDRREDFLAKGLDGAPVFLLHDANGTGHRPRSCLRHFSATFSVTCKVSVEARIFEGRFAVLQCGAEHPELYELFIRCVSAAIATLSVGAGTAQLERCVKQLVGLFRGLQAPSRKEVSGLWAELWVIANSLNCKASLEAWHSDPFERFDFSGPSFRVEVKATTQARRIHEFSKEQLSPPDGESSGVVVSMLLQSESGGIGILELAEAIDKQLKDDWELSSKLWSGITATLGSDFSDKLDVKFDNTYAAKNVSVFDMQGIPVPITEDSRISHVRFRVDLGLVNARIPQKREAVLAGLFGVSP